MAQQKQIRERTRFRSRPILAWMSCILLSSLATRDLGDKEPDICSDASTLAEASIQALGRGTARAYIFECVGE
jgi:hypothetical protein